MKKHITDARNEIAIKLMMLCSRIATHHYRSQLAQYITDGMSQREDLTDAAYKEVTAEDADVITITGGHHR